MNNVYLEKRAGAEAPISDERLVSILDRMVP